MTVAEVKPGAANGARAGTQVLRLLSTPLNAHVLQALAEGPRSLMDLRREAGSPPQTTMRGNLRTLAETDVVVRRRQNDFPGSLDFELTPVGQELWAVARVLNGWLRAAPEGPLPLGSAGAKSAVKALVEGWGTTMVRALAARPLSLTELNGLINGISYPSLERRLGAMRLAGQIERTSGPGRSTPYAVTGWLRRAVAPLGAAARWERLHAPRRTTPIKRLDTEAAFLLAMPLLSLPAKLSGTCRLAVEIGGSNGEGSAGVLVGVREGQVVSCVAAIRGHADAWASGSPSTWLQVVIEQDTDRLEVGGDCDLVRALIDGLHWALFEALRQS
ncbi:MAG: winged helix-turn-helix transcriptional regulator [Solirubrobacterales bacterium]